DWASPGIFQYRSEDEKQRVQTMTAMLDTKGMNCPLPILKTRKVIKGLAVGDTLQVLSTDPGSVRDFEAFCRSTGNELVESGEENGTFVFLIKKTL
ncbi:MAG TPA: sulfurtransferase TusA family protein, partial [Rhodospirillales bacterium]|nr:sulfurtransferase TusA family protein [Rhodospirillales bacterium]